MRSLNASRVRVGIGCVAALSTLAGVAASVAMTAPAAAAGRAGACAAANTQVWVGLGGGGGYAGGYVLPLEFTNVGRHACTLYGYPGVSAYRGAMRRVGPPATRIQTAHASVTLMPGATAHASLRVADTGAVCGRGGVSATGVEVYAPGQRSAKTVALPLKVCAHAASLGVGAVKAGVGVPGYVTQ